MDKIIAWLGKNSLRVNYFTFFIISVFFNVVAVFLPFAFNVVVVQVLRFLMIFSIAMYVTDSMKILRTSFWGLLAYCGVNLLLGVSYSIWEVMKDVTFNAIVGALLSLVYLFVLILLLRHARPKMKSIVVSLLILELYNICKPFIFNVLSSVWGVTADSEAFVVCWTIIPFLLMLPLFILIAKNGKDKWVHVRS